MHTQREEGNSMIYAEVASTHQLCQDEVSTIISFLSVDDVINLALTSKNFLELVTSSVKEKHPKVFQPKWTIRNALREIVLSNDEQIIRFCQDVTINSLSNSNQPITVKLHRCKETDIYSLNTLFSNTRNEIEITVPYHRLESLTNMLSYLPNLGSLCISSAPMLQNISYMLPIFLKLKKMKLHCMDERILKMFIRSAPSLTSFKVTKNNVSSSVIISIANCCPHLKHFFINDINHDYDDYLINDYCLIYLLRKCKIETLDIPWRSK